MYNMVSLFILLFQVRPESQFAYLPYWQSFKGNQKGKVTCYARERVNKNELFWMVITFLKSVVY